MALSEVAADRWQRFFDDLSRELPAEAATVRVSGPLIGKGAEAQWLALEGISYEPAADTLTIFLEGWEHRIRHPRSIHVDRDVDGLRSLQAVDLDANRHTVLFRPAIAMPAA